MKYVTYYEGNGSGWFNEFSTAEEAVDYIESYWNNLPDKEKSTMDYCFAGIPADENYEETLDFDEILIDLIKDYRN